MLTAREMEVLALVAEGRSNGAIDAKLVISDRAVEKTSPTSSPNSTYRRPKPTTAEYSPSCAISKPSAPSSPAARMSEVVGPGDLQ